MSKRADALVIRPARPDEHLELEALQRRASLANEDDREALEAHPEEIRLPPEQISNGQVFVAELDGRAAGFAALVDGELDGLFVEPAFWRQGIGAALVNFAAHQARRRGHSLWVIANPSARKFYETYGFSVEGEVMTRFGPALKMSR